MNLVLQEQRQQSLTQTRTEQWFWNINPLLSARKDSILSLSEALKDTKSFVLIDKELGDGVSLKWIKAQLLDMFRILGAADTVSSIQVVVIARRIRNVYYYLTASELTYFLESLIGGCYGTVYVGKTINPQNIMEALKRFDTERANSISESEYNTHNKIKDQEKHPVDIGFVNAICERFNKQYKEKRSGCNAPKSYTYYKEN